MPRVLRIINRFNLGGPTYNVAYLTKYLSPEYETLLVGGAIENSEASSEFILKKLGLKYEIIPELKRSINPINDFIAYQKIKKIIREFKPDIVHTHAAKAGTLGRAAAFACKIPITVHTFHGHVFHSYFGSLTTFFYKIIERKLASKTSAIIAISNKQQYELVTEYKISSTKNTYVIPLGFDLNRFAENVVEKRKDFREKYKLNRDEIAIGIVGRLVPVKNHSLFLYAIKFVQENAKKKIRAFIIGDGQERMKLETLAIQLLIKDCVVFTSWENEVDKIYPGLDIVCLTSFNEGTPVSLIEAQAANRPIVTTNVGGVVNVVDSTTTFLANDDQEFCSKLFSLVEDDNLRMSMSNKGFDFVKSKFTYSRLIHDMARLYSDLLK